MFKNTINRKYKSTQKMVVNGILQGHRSQIEGTPNGQIWNNLSKTINSNGL